MASVVETSMPKRRVRTIVAIATVVVLAAVGAVVWFLSQEAPAEVDLAETAREVLGQPTTSGGPVATAEPVTTVAAMAAEDVAGTWRIDTTVGGFTLEDTTTATFAGFRVEEVLSGIGSATAVGRTPDVTGSITIDGSTLTSAEVVATLTSLVSDQSRRESAIHRALDTRSNPEAVFSLTAPVELGDEAALGEVVSTVARGDLTLNGVTSPIEFDIEAQLVDDRILVTATSEVDFADFDITAPTSPVVLSVEDHGIVEVQLWLTKA